MKLAVIADDFTGATDIASFLVENGLQAIQFNGIPADDVRVDADAIVISLKSRSIPREQAESLSLRALDWFRARGAEKIFFKYCSTFDSTEEGNIGPVTDALMQALGEKLTVVCPALPVNGRSVYKGYLFVGDVLLNESGMRNHPLNPMNDASLIRLMDNQSSGKTGLIDLATVRAGSDAILAALRAKEAEGYRYVVIDSVSMEDLHVIAKASYDHLNLFTGGSGLGEGIAAYLCENSADAGQATEKGRPMAGPGVVFSGSCSEMTRKQVGYYKRLAPSFQIDMGRCMEDGAYASDILDWYLAQKQSSLAPLIYSTMDAAPLQDIQKRYGLEKSSTAVEALFSRIASGLREQGVRNFIVAGGETSGSVVQSLGIHAFYIGPRIAPGVPWVTSIDSDISLALKSGNFGSEDFFELAQGFF